MAAIINSMSLAVASAIASTTQSVAANVAEIEEPFSLAKTLGVVAITLFVLAILSALFRRLKPKLLLNVHKIFAWLAITAAIGHVVMMEMN